MDQLHDDIKQRLIEYVESVTTKSSKGGHGMYVCPLCGSGSGKHHTGAFSISQTDQTHWHCFKCGRGGDVFDLIGLLEQIDEPRERFKRAREIFGVQQDTAKRQQKRTTKESPSINMNAEPKSMLPYFRECHARLSETDYPERRGLSRDVCDKFLVGYDPAYKTGGQIWQALIIPTSHYSYVARNVDPNADASSRYRKTGSSTPLNMKALQSADQPIFLVEGEIDALSIIEAGGEAIGLGSTSNAGMFIKKLQDTPPVRPLVLALDNDDAGDVAADRLITELQQLKIPFYRHDVCGDQKDPNAALLADRVAFTAAVEHARVLEQEQQTAQKNKYLQTSAAAHIQQFVNGILSSADTPAQKTGFSRLDDVLDGGLYEGLYIIGAVTSLGKTTLALQIMDQIAQSGRDVIIFSLEMARTELMSKSISRHTILDVMEDRKNRKPEWAKTSRGITAGYRYEGYSDDELAVIRRAIESYRQYAEHVFIHEGIGDIGTAEIRQVVQTHIKITGERPVVLIDYVQILAAHDVRATDKQVVDRAVLELKRLSRDFKIPVVGISSLNRASYKQKISLEAFKESGALEYGSDVLIGLQFAGAGDQGFDVAHAKTENPRHVEMLILKNRNGKTGTVLTYDYYPLFNLFTENAA